SRAFLTAAQQIESLTSDVAKVYESGGLEEIRGVGRGIAATIGEYLTTETSSLLEKLRKQLPDGALELMAIEGIGPKTAAKLIRELGITSAEQLETALRAGRIRSLPGFGKKTEENLRRILKEKTPGGKRRLLGGILPIVREIEDYLTRLNEGTKVSVAGSTRRMKETVGDIDVLAAGQNAEKTAEHFTSMPGIRRVVSKGSSRSTVIVEGNLQIDLRIVRPESYGAALQYFTGSKGHNIKLRSLALQRGCKLNEYGLFRRDSGERIAGETEESIYEALKLQSIEPELREDCGEVEAALEGRLPRIMEYGEIKGDLHVHSNWSDGTGSLKEIAEAARKRRLKYVAICDHSKALGIARGLNEERVRKQMRQIERLNRTFEDFRLLKGTEVDIMSDGALDLPNSLLKDLDIVVASLHRGFRSPEEKLTNRIMSAIHNDHVTTIGHPTGRIILKRPPYPLNLPRIFKAASDQRVMMEINAFPDRLDLNDVHSKLAKKYRVRLAIGTDAHTPAQMNYLELGVSVARRAWLEASDVANSLNAKDLLR
ncbi:MAG: DNA polymerase/3'-5' exonuclease PolX, partial [Candidatus Bathyarchaeota archaeon]|nr:DNA polymerase/3'-5' exonuclease PolX [Candidatus Bathyarchaeota archaeon]